MEQLDEDEERVLRVVLEAAGEERDLQKDLDTAMRLAGKDYLRPTTTEIIVEWAPPASDNGARYFRYVLTEKGETYCKEHNL